MPQHPLITGSGNPAVKHAVKLGKDASFRRREKAFLAPGAKAVSDSIDRGFVPIRLFFSPEGAKRHSRLFESYDCALVKDSRLEKLKESATEDGVWGVFAFKEERDSDIFSRQRILALEDIQDPGNVGAVFRRALALGYPDIAVSAGCADPFSRKVIRSSMTASLKVRLYRQSDMADFLRRCRRHGFCTVASCLAPDALPLGGVNIPQKHTLFIGNEGNGLSRQVINRRDIRLKIPMKGQIESLNAAVSAGILMWGISG